MRCALPDREKRRPGGSQRDRPFLQQVWLDELDIASGKTVTGWISVCAVSASMRPSTLKPHCKQITENRFIAFLSDQKPFRHTFHTLGNVGALPASARNTVAARIRQA
jgi:hypothetical protein